MHLISFSSVEDKTTMIESNWLENWFIAIRDVNMKSSSLWREVWIKVYGVPLFAWGYENFYNIGCIFGRVISVDHSRFDYARVLVFTDCMFTINNNMALEINEEKHKIFVSEECCSNELSFKTQLSHNSGQRPPEKSPVRADPSGESLDESSQHSYQEPENTPCPTCPRNLNKSDSPKKPAFNDNDAFSVPNTIGNDCLQSQLNNFMGPPHPIILKPPNQTPPLPSFQSRLVAHTLQ